MRARAGGRDPGSRPTAELSAAALQLVERHAAQVMACARRYAATPEDAEDAYQRGLEILLTRAPTTSEDELVPWLKTVIKHEAFALRRQRDRHTPTGGGDEPPDRPGGPPTIDQAERLERLQLGAEALGRLKPQEVRALQLRAEGHSYDEICRITGWTYTKVNRCLSEGRRAFLRRLEGIEAGEECERLAPHLSALADGEATAKDMAALRTHMRTCLSCRARLREFRDAPARVAALVAPAALSGATDVGNPLRAGLESLAAGLGDRVSQTAEMVSGSKVAAVAASAALVAGGGAATVDHLGGQDADGPPRLEREEARAESPKLPSGLAAPAAQAAEPPRVTETDASAAPVEVPRALGSPGAVAPSSSPAPAPRQPDPANEFAPGGGASVPPSASATGSGGGEFGGGGGSGGGGEFGP